MSTQFLLDNNVHQNSFGKSCDLVASSEGQHQKERSQMINISLSHDLEKELIVPSEVADFAWKEAAE